MACELPRTEGVPLSRFSRAELHRLVIERGVTEAQAAATDSLRLVREHEIVIGHPTVAASLVDALVGRGEAATAWQELARDNLTGDPPPGSPQPGCSKLADDCGGSTATRRAR